MSRGEVAPCEDVERLHGSPVTEYRTADVGGPDWPPRCTQCDTPMEMAPQEMRLDLKSDGGTDQSFQKFSISVDGKPVLIDSLHKLRQVEKESEQRYRNGEGEPIRFRMWNQTASNKDVHTFGEQGTIGDQTYSSGERPAKSGKVAVRRHGETKPTVKLGPGMRRAVTALREESHD